MSPRKAARSNWFVWALMALLTALLSVYAQWRAFAWDEGWHLVAAQSINRGKRPYLDFCYPQTPLNAYWNAAWMRVFGGTWHTPHAVAGVMTSLAVLLTAAYLLRRFPEPGWRVATAVAAMCTVGMNIMVVEFGTIAQAYGLCLFVTMSAFWSTIRAVDRKAPWLAGLAGLLASTAANCSLLTAPVAPVLLIWMLVCNRAGNRWAKLFTFAAGAAIPCTPLAWLYLQGPRQAIFNVLHYNLSCIAKSRGKGRWPITFGEWFAWVGSPQALILGLLALAGVLFIRKAQWLGPHAAPANSTCAHGWLWL